jgi:hypothetical protein
VLPTVKFRLKKVHAALGIVQNWFQGRPVRFLNWVGTLRDQIWKP